MILVEYEWTLRSTRFRVWKSDGMAKRQQTAEIVEALLQPIAAAHGVRIYDVEYVKEGQEYYLRAFIDKDGGVTIDDCVDVSHDLSDALDAADPIQDAYTLEVSSPGLGRRLTKDRHLAASIGASVEGTTFRPPEGSSTKSFEGILKAFDRDTVTIAPYPEESGIEAGEEDRAADSGSAQETAVSSGDPEQDLVLERKNIARIQLTLDF